MKHQTKTIPPIHPGEHLSEFLADMAIAPHQAAGDLGAPVAWIRAIIKGERDITADMGLRLAKYFGQSDGFWILLQAKYGKEKARRAITDATKLLPSLRIRHSRRHEGAARIKCLTTAASSGNPGETSNNDFLSGNVKTSERGAGLAVIGRDARTPR